MEKAKTRRNATPKRFNPSSSKWACLI